ncbi:MAG TPA: amidohydrolase family protein [Vicinamibacteria bacterium]|nr:amidohydrolase family protein [Vicinamibacteria bacterium]
MRVAVLLASSALAMSCASPVPPADLVFVRGSIFGAEEAGALAVDEGRIVSIGGEPAVRDYMGRGTAVIDLDGRMLVPSFADAHVHLYAGSESLDWPLVREAASYDELLDILRVHALSLPPGEWLQGVGWRHHIVDPVRRAGTIDLDSAFPDRPVRLISQEARVWASSRAIDAGGPAERSHQEQLRILRRGIRYLHRFGITAVETSGLLFPEPRNLYSELQRQGELELHVHFSETSTHEAEVSSALNAAEKRGTHRIDGVVRLSPLDIERLRDRRLLVRVHPFKISPDWVPVRHRKGHEFPLRTLERAGVRLAFGSDWPLASLDPLAGIAAAVTRQDFDGTPENGWLPEERISVGEAVFAYTGRLPRVGELADLAVVSQDLLELPTELLAAAKVDMTVFSGKIVYVSESFLPELDSSVRMKLR